MTIAGARPGGRAPAIVTYAIFFPPAKLDGQTHYGPATQYVDSNPTRSAVLGYSFKNQQLAVSGG